MKKPTMLNKEICKKCTELTNWLTWDDFFENDDLWEEGYVLCPATEEWFGEETTIITKRGDSITVYDFKHKKSFPKKCPYKLEHILISKKSKP